MSNEELKRRIGNLEDEIVESFKSFGQAIAVANKSKGIYVDIICFLYLPGLVLAMILSYTASQSILKTIIHGYLSWGYVIYRLIF